MDVTKLQKMNVLASALKEHGLAASREDAAELAGDMVGTKNEDEFGKVFVQPEPVQEAPEKEVSQVDEQQMKNILQNFADQFCGEINKINERLTTYEETLSKIQSEPQVQEPQIQEPVAQVNLPQVEPAPKVEQVTLEPEPAEPQESPRSGGFSSEDVAIDKFFYFGQK